MMTCVSLRSGMASSGVFRSAQSDPAAARIVRTMMRNGFRALASITRSMSVIGVGCAGVGFSMASSEVLQCALDLRLGVHEEIAAGNHPFPFLQALCHPVEITELTAELNKSGFQASLTLVHKDDIMLAGRQHCAKGNREPLPFVERKRHINIGVGPEFQVTIVHIDPHPAGALHGV